MVHGAAVHALDEWRAAIAVPCGKINGPRDLRRGPSRKGEAVESVGESVREKLSSPLSRGLSNLEVPRLEGARTKGEWGKRAFTPPQSAART
jgi:hypothetical protein